VSSKVLPWILSKAVDDLKDQDQDQDQDQDRDVAVGDLKEEPNKEEEKKQGKMSEKKKESGEAKPNPKGPSLMPPRVDSEWQCPACTFKNTVAGLESCAICGSPKPLLEELDEA